MHINRSNYIEFFLLYIDNELNTEQREALNDFIQQHPDLEHELLQLKHVRLEPDTEIVLNDKESLLQHSTEPFITIENVENFFVLYADNELTNEQKAAVELFVYHHPQLQAEFELIQKIRLTPDPAIIFTEKGSLLHHEKLSDKTLVFRWWNIAAAWIILFIGIFWLVSQNLDQEPDKVANTRHDVNLVQPGNIRKTQKSNENQNDQLPEPNLVKAKTFSEAIAKKAVKRDMARNDPHKKNSFDRLQEKKAFVFSGSLIVDTSKSAIRKNIARSKIDDAISVENRMLTHRRVSLPDDRDSNEPEIETIVFAAVEKPDNVYFANLPLNNKQFFRGVYRKATRFIDKKTGILNAERTGLRLGNVEIAIQ